jgi:putative ABC transport system permease protein
MRHSDSPLRQIRRLFRRPPGEQVAAELAFHVEMRTRDLVANGTPPAEAAVMARAAFANRKAIAAECVSIAIETERLAGRREYLSDLRDDARYASRQLLRSPAFTLGVVATLALGIGVSSTVFSLVDAIFWRWPAGVEAPAGVQRVWTVDRQGRTGAESASADLEYPRFLAITAAAAPNATALYTVTPDASVRIGTASLPIHLAYATASLFPLLGARPMLGGFYTVDEDLMGAGAPVVVVSERFWRSVLGADPQVIGSRLDIARTPYTVIGVAAAPFTGADLEAVDAWVPLGGYPGTGIGGRAWWESRNYSGFQMLIRGVGGHDAQFAAQATIAVRSADRQVGSVDSTVRVTTGSLILARGPGKQAPELAIATRLGGVALMLLMIVSANVLGLMLSRAVRRRHEIAMRLALGISHARLARLLMTESAILALLAAVAASAAAAWGGGVLRALLFPDMRWAVAPMHWHVLLFAGVAAGAVALLAGVVPLVHLLRSGTSIAVKSRGRPGGRASSRVRALAVATQVALSTVLLVGAALFVQSLRNVEQLDVGYDTDRLIYAGVRPNLPADRSAIDRRVDAIVQSLGPATGVERTSRTSREPMQRGGFGIPWYTDQDSMGARAGFRPTVTRVASGYVATVGLPLVAGADFRPGETGAIVNETMAHGIWHARSPLGECLHLGRPDSPCHMVVGVVRDAKRSNITEPPLPQYFISSADSGVTGAPEADMAVLRVRPDRAARVAATLRQRLGAEFPDARVTIDRLSTVMETQYRPWRLGALLFSVFGILALAVASIGIYSTVSYEVAQRFRDFGIRAALGARLLHIVAVVMRAGLVPVVSGIGAGVIVALLAGHAVAALLYGIGASNVGAFGAAALVLLSVSTVAVLVPARRAARVDPLVALREE